MNTNNVDGLDIQKIFKSILNSEEGIVKNVTIDSTTYFVASDLIKVLGLSNVTRIINNINNSNCINDKQICVKKNILGISKFRPSHLVTIEGVLQLILNGNSKICNRIKYLFAINTLPKIIYKLA
jgi:prophage antirepressor-like protein